MKRLVLSTILTLAIHGLLLSSKAEWLLKQSTRNPTPVPISFTLAYQEPIKPILPPEKWLKSPPPPPKGKPPEPAIEQPPIQASKPEPIKETDKVIKVASRPKKVKVASKPKPPPPLPPPELEFSSAAENQEVKEAPGAFQESPRVDTKETSPETKDILASVQSSPSLREAVPMYRENPYPRYPRIARRRGYQGTVVLEVLVNPEGRVGDLRVLESSGHNVLDQAAMVSVKQWLFEPGMKGDEKVAMWVKIPIRFQLKK